MRALTITEPGHAEIRSVPKPPKIDGSLLLKVQMVGLCGSDLNSFRGKNPLVNLPRVPGHEVSATIVEGNKHYPLLVEGLNVTLSPYTSCGACAACREAVRMLVNSTRR